MVVVVVLVVVGAAVVVVVVDVDAGEPFATVVVVVERGEATPDATVVISVFAVSFRNDTPPHTGSTKTATSTAYSTRVAPRSVVAARERRSLASAARIPLMRTSVRGVHRDAHGPSSRAAWAVGPTVRPMDATSDGRTDWGELDGVKIEFPMVVEEMRSATLTFTVPIEPARALVPGDAFEVLEVSPGHAMLVIALCDYVRNPWGDYDEVNLGLLVHPVGRPEAAGAFQWRMPVDQEFTCKAGNLVMGLPKTVEDLTFDYSAGPGEGTVAVRLVMSDEPEGSVTLLVRLPRPSVDGTEAPVESATTYSYLDGVPMSLGLDMELPPVPLDPGEVEIELGSGALADELRSLGLPATADLALWGEGLSATFQVPRPIGAAVETGA